MTAQAALLYGAYKQKQAGLELLRPSTLLTV